jgi:hypothetical protein
VAICVIKGTLVLRACNHGSDKWVDTDIHMGARDVCDGSKELKEKIEGMTGFQVCVCVCVWLCVCIFDDLDR